MIPALIAAGASIAGGAAQQSAAKSAQNENRKYNLSLAQQQNKWSIDQWRRENDYNTPAAMARRGLNPDLVYGGGASATSAASPTLTSGSPSQPRDTAGYQQATAGVQQAAQMALQTRLLKAQAENLEADAQGKQIDNKTRGEQNEAILNETNIRINGLSETSALTAAQRQKIEAEIPNIKALGEEIQSKIDNLRSQTENISFDQMMRRTQLYIDKTYNDAKIKQMSVQNGLTYAQTKQILDCLPDIVANLAATRADTMSSTNLRNTQRSTERLRQLGLYLENGMLSIDLDNKNYSQSIKQKIRHDVNTVDSYTFGAATAMQIINDVMGTVTSNFKIFQK